MSRSRESATTCDLKRVLVLGLGNILLQDDGLGIRVLEQLQRDFQLPACVTLMDGAVMGLELLPYMEQSSALVVLDAVQTGQPPGTLVRLEGEDIPATLATKLSVHQIGFQESLAMGRFCGTLPETMVLLGAEPDVIDLGVYLSPAVESQIETLAQMTVDELHSWGIPVNPATPV